MLVLIGRRPLAVILVWKLFLDVTVLLKSFLFKEVLVEFHFEFVLSRRFLGGGEEEAELRLPVPLCIRPRVVVKVLQNVNKQINKSTWPTAVATR